MPSPYAVATAAWRLTLLGGLCPRRTSAVGARYALSAALSRSAVGLGWRSAF